MRVDLLQELEASTRKSSGQSSQGVVLYTTSSLVVEGANRKPYAISQPLVSAGHFPRHGWQVVFKFVGIDRTIHEDDAVGVFKEVRRLLDLNNEQMTDLDIWLNLNIQWTRRVTPKYQIVRPQALLDISEPRS